MTARETGKIIRQYLTGIGSDARVTAREVSFEDLARGSSVVVTLTGAPSYADRAFWDGIKSLSKSHHFIAI